MSEIAYVGLGSNLDQPLARIRRALQSLRELACAEPRVSRLYGSRALGPGTQPDYVNAVARLEVRTTPHALLEGLQAIERAQGRTREGRWHARTLDLDLLLFGDTVLDTPRLTLPHPRIAERPFVLYPLHDLDPALAVPGAGRVAELLRGCPFEGLWLLEDVAPAQGRGA